ncbi:TonB-dependent receptor [Aquisediminimonas profunda]|uniref:TonB-dependent receptor n=1 Tax=Aquisediminimonas profunda TaxID=1550733 RepID=UPI001C62F30D|nr:TonB-dependent receptor [Aquisediminimonas profunda]
MMTALFHDSIRRAGSMRNLLLASVGAASLLSMPAYAQTAPAEEDSGEIFVTARKTTEALQDVPVTVTAVTSDTLETYGANQVQDVAGRVPTLNVQVGGSGSGGSISLRGVGSSAISASFDSAVAFDFDGVVQSSMRLVQAGFFDVKQIEVLKGPQSLFFGKSASAGVFSLHSADPTKNWEIAGKASYEFEERGYVAGGYISGPITDTLGIRIAAQYNDVSRYNQIQPGVGTVNPNRGLKDFVGRVTLNWEPTDRFKANLKLNYITNRNDGASQFLDIYCGFNGRADEVVLLGGAIAIPNKANCNYKDKYFAIPDASSTATTKFPAGSAGEKYYPGHPFGRTNIFFGRLKWDLDLTDTLTFSSTTGLMKLNSIDFDSYSYAGTGPAFNPNGIPIALIAPRLAAINGVGVPLGMGSSDPQNKTYQFSQEYRLASDFEGPFNFQLGAFYEYRKLDFNTSQQAVNISIIAADPITGATYDYYKKHQTKTNTVSFFGSATYDITDQLELSGGLRWTDEKKVNTITVPYVHRFLGPGPAFIGSGFFSGPIRFKDSNVSPEVSLRYKVTPDVSIYAAYKTGFKSGGIDNSALPSNSLSQAALSGDFSSLIYKSETAKGGEVGAKMQLAGRSLTINVSAFDYIFKNLQLQNFNSTTVQFVTFNASELTSKGADIDFAWKTPVEGLRFSGGLAYTDAKFTKDLNIARNPDPQFPESTVTATNPKPSENLKGRAVSRAPKFAGNVAFDWTVPVSDSLEFGLNGNMAYSGSYWTANNSNFTAEQRPFGDVKQKSYVTFDGSISISAPDKKWKLSLVGLNLANKIYVLTSGTRPFAAPAGGYGTPGTATYVPRGDDIGVNINRGRQVFVEASFKF